MMEPSAYLLLSGILFGIGVAGVVARKNVLIILMSVEIMLNAVNVAFIAVGSSLGDVTGSVFAFIVMTGAGREGPGHGTRPRGGSSHGAGSHGAGHHAAPPYRRLVSFLGPAVVGASFIVSLLSVLALAARPARDRLLVPVLFPWGRGGGGGALAP